MGVKSTTRLTREQAIAKYVNLKAELKERKWRAQAERLNNVELENVLEEMNDEAYDRRYGDSDGGFDNYSIVAPEDLDR
jgi:hypothetical protein